MDRAFAQYASIRDHLRDLTISDVRQHFEVLRQLDDRVLAGLLNRLGYTSSGSKNELAQRLLANLERMHVTETQRKAIQGRDPHG